ncbi:PAS domain S-box protein [Haloarcula nitratireducens]|uniref:histidine kinase n=1 Tax=Haloarcula nitratireducens TaxID=2487749 RepID=A0AAW4P889_9EURY|nr:PAS domain S-box protein [Halomicroarcula nitratireducens]MBX0294119.1 PAS domain S-box protein [Halomicroarcula nitratireducens]
MVETIRVLHVDDDPAFVELTAEFLEAEGERVVVSTATSASEGLETLETESIDCVVSDFEMPEMNGLELLDAVREKYPELPFVLFTGKGSEEVASEAIVRGATDYLQKQSGTDQYALLANRIRNAVETYRSARHAAEEERISTVVREVNRVLVRAGSCADIETRICELVSRADPYQFAWIGHLDAETDRIEPSSWAGDGAYLDDIRVTADESDTGLGPAGTALREQRFAATQDVKADPDFTPWREAALERGFRSVAGIPLTYDSERNGVLVVYADRPRAFDETEEQLLTELGDDIAHALHARQVRTDLERTTVRLEGLFENSPDMIDLHDETGTIVDANPMLCEKLGYSVEELVGTKVWEIDDRLSAEDAQDLWTGLDPGERYELRSEFRRRDGSTFPVEVHLRRLRDEGDDRFLVTSHDITDQRERQQQLEARSAAIESATDGMAILDEDDGYTFVNQAHADVYGYDSPEAFYGESWRMCYERAEAERFEREVMPTLAAEGEWLGKATGRRQSGETFTQEISLTQLDDGSIICVVRDITEREAHRQRLEQLQRRTKALMTTQSVAETATVAVDVADDVLGAELSGFHELSEDGRRLPLLTETDSLQSTFETLPRYERDSGDPVASVVWEAYDRESPRYIDDCTEHERLAGNTPAGSGVIYPIPDHGVFIVSAREPNAFDETDHALTDILASTVTAALQRVDRESLLRDRERELTRQNERLAEFANVVSHDLRNPLSVLEGSLELAEETGDAEHFERGRQALSRMEQLIDDVLALARQGGSVDDVDVVEVETIAEACWRNVATGEASLHVEPGGSIRASESRFKQLVENLFRNSVEHGDQPVAVTVGVLDDGRGFYVEDDGDGIPPAERERVFESGYSNASDGTGFGLAIVERIVAAHGWQIAIGESDAGGARFEITGVEPVE